MEIINNKEVSAMKCGNMIKRKGRLYCKANVGCLCGVMELEKCGDFISKEGMKIKNMNCVILGCGEPLKENKYGYFSCPKHDTHLF